MDGSGAARVRGAPCATSPVSTGTRSASGFALAQEHVARDLQRCATADDDHSPLAPHPRRDGGGATLTFTPPNDPPLDRAHLGAHAPSNRRGSRHHTAAGALSLRARAHTHHRRRRRPTRPQEESTRRPRARRPSRRAPRASSRVTFRRPTGTARQPRRLGARSARAPRAASSPPPSLFAATRARGRLVSSIASSPPSLARSLARGLHLVGHLSIEREGAHVAVIPVREHPDDPAPTALVLAGSKGLRSPARAHALSTRGSVPDRWGHAHTVLSPIVHPRALAFPLSGQPSLREELTRVSLLPWSVARALGIDGFLPPTRANPKVSRRASRSRPDSRAARSEGTSVFAWRRTSTRTRVPSAVLRERRRRGGIRRGILVANDRGDGRRRRGERVESSRGRTRASRRSARGSTPRAPGDRRFFVGAIRASPPSPRTCRFGRTRRAQAAVEARLRSSRRERETEAYLWWTRETRGDACATAADG